MTVVPDLNSDVCTHVRMPAHIFMLTCLRTCLRACRRTCLHTCLHSGLSDKDANICVNVSSANAERPDLTRMFQLVEFGDLKAQFSARFPLAELDVACRFARALSDEAGCSSFSVFQIETYLQGSTDAQQALTDWPNRLLSLEKAQKARVKPAKPEPPAECTESGYVWMKGKKLEQHWDHFEGQAIVSVDDLKAAEWTHELLEKIGVGKLGDRCKI